MPDGFTGGIMYKHARAAIWAPKFAGETPRAKPHPNDALSAEQKKDMREKSKRDQKRNQFLHEVVRIINEDGGDPAIPDYLDGETRAEITKCGGAFTWAKGQKKFSKILNRHKVGLQKAHLKLQKEHLKEYLLNVARSFLSSQSPPSPPKILQARIIPLIEKNGSIFNWAKTHPDFRNSLNKASVENKRQSKVRKQKTPRARSSNDHVQSKGSSKEKIGNELKKHLNQLKLQGEPRETLIDCVIRHGHTKQVAVAYVYPMYGIDRSKLRSGPSPTRPRKGLQK
jgi:hypothetical protein